MIVSGILTLSVMFNTVFALDFTDVKQGDWYFGNLNTLVQKNIASGYDDGSFKPNNELKFEEFIKMLIVAVDEKTIDAAAGQKWYQRYIDYAIENKYITEQQKAVIGQNIDLKTMSEILYNVILNTETFDAYSEDDLIYLNSKLTDLTNKDNKILTIAGLGVICGYPDKTFKPANNLTRSETVTVISRLINKDMRLPIKIISLEDLPKVDLSHLYDYPTLSGLSVEEENQYYYQYGQDYIQTVVNDYVDYMNLMNNRDYTKINKNVEQYKANLLYYLNGNKEYHGKEYFGLRSDSLSNTNDPALIEYINYETDDYIEDFFTSWVQDTIDNKVQVQSKFYTNENLLHDADGMSAVRGTLRFRYDNHNNPNNIKEELDLVKRDAQIAGQRILNLNKNKYNIYMDYSDIPDFEIEKWYEIDMDIVVSSKAYVHGLNKKAKLSYEYIYPIEVREIE